MNSRRCEGEVIHASLAAVLRVQRRMDPIAVVWVAEMSFALRKAAGSRRVWPPCDHPFAILAGGDLSVHFFFTDHEWRWLRLRDHEARGFGVRPKNRGMELRPFGAVERRKRDAAEAPRRKAIRRGGLQQWRRPVSRTMAPLKGRSGPLHADSDRETRPQLAPEDDCCTATSLLRSRYPIREAASWPRF